MKRNLHGFIIIFILAVILAAAGGCSCSNGSDSADIPVSAEPSVTITEGVTSSSDSGTGDESDTTAPTESTETSPSDATTAATTTTTEPTTVSSTASADNRNAPGVSKPDYKEDHYIVVHTGSQSVAVYGKDADGYYNQLVKCFTCSTGKKGHDTRTGLYKIRRKYRWRLLVGNVYGQYSSGFSESYLFHSVPYLKQSIDTLDNEEYDKLGTPASHGCVRLCVRDSKWIYDNCPIGTQVNVINTEGPAGAGVPERNPDPAYNGWDPSDKWGKHNPYFYSPSTAATTTTTAATTTVTSQSAEATSVSLAETTTAATETETTTAAATTTTTTAADTAATTTTAAPVTTATTGVPDDEDL